MNLFKFNLYFLGYLSNDMNLFNHRYHWYLNWYLSWHYWYLNRGFYDHCGLRFNNFGLYDFFFHNYNFSLCLSFFSLCYGLGFSLCCCQFSLSLGLCCSFSCLFSLKFGLCFGFSCLFGFNL